MQMQTLASYSCWLLRSLDSQVQSRSYQTGHQAKNTIAHNLWCMYLLAWTCDHVEHDHRPCSLAIRSSLVLPLPLTQDSNLWQWNQIHWVQLLRTPRKLRCQRPTDHHQEPASKFASWMPSGPNWLLTLNDGFWRQQFLQWFGHYDPISSICFHGHDSI